MEYTDQTWNLSYDLMQDYNENYWTTKDGRNIKIELMETTHIRNAINMLKKNIQNLKDYEDDYEKEYYKDYFEFKINELEEELKKRDIYKRHLIEKE